MLDSFEIDNFRTFRHLRLTGLGQVNLFVGENNCGKTMLLSALRLHGASEPWWMLADLLQSCEEFERGNKEGSLVYSVLFHRHRGPELSVGPEGAEDKLRVRLLTSSSATEKRHTLEFLRRGAAHTVPVAELERELDAYHEYADLPPLLVPVEGLNDHQVGLWWDDISLTEAEERVVQCLRLVASIRRINLVERPGGGRSVMVKMDGTREPVPLRSLGDGMRRMFLFAMALERSRNSMLLIDEFENGIYYEAQTALWRFLREGAKAQGVQIFATTHSSDCINAFARTMSEDPEITAALIRLQRAQDNDVRAVPYSKDELALATQRQIEVRSGRRAISRRPPP